MSDSPSKAAKGTGDEGDDVSSKAEKAALTNVPPATEGAEEAEGGALKKEDVDDVSKGSREDGKAGKDAAEDSTAKLKEEGTSVAVKIQQVPVDEVCVRVLS